MEDYSNREKNDLEIDDDKEHSVSMLREPFLVRNRKNNTSQIAIVGAITCPIESLDYEIAENELLKQDWRSRKKAEIFQYVVLKWTLALLIGLGTGLVGFFNNLAIENIAGFKLLVTNNLMLKEITGTIRHLQLMLVAMWFWLLLLQPYVLMLLLRQQDLVYQRLKHTSMV